MSREQQYTAIVIKKQALGESDEIITFYTHELGKVRAVAKSSKLPKSKLQSQLQPMFVCQLTLAGSSSLPTIIRVQADKSFPNIQNDSDRSPFWYVVAELVLKATPDEEQNEMLFSALEQFLEFLNTPVISPDDALRGLLKFKLMFTDALGFNVVNSDADLAKPIFFSNSFGGFVQDEKPFDASHIRPDTLTCFNTLRNMTYSEITGSNLGVDELNGLLTQFISYQLEREIKSEKFV
ncbi:MAG: DNA repair protein RecO [Candidatus Doudnabacteria bacterium]|nr:DNA repair protein RecO [Candidatus Doudnabacteria bacterium]